MESAGNDGKTLNKLYPNETWKSEKISDSASLFISSSREEDGAKDPAVYESDKMMASVLAKETGKDVFMLPERNKGGKNPDCYFEGATLEMKHVRGAQRKVGKNAVYALEQSENVFLYIDKSFSIEACLSGINGFYYRAKNQAEKDGLPFIEPNSQALLCIFVQGTLHRHTWGDVL